VGYARPCLIHVQFSGGVTIWKRAVLKQVASRQSEDSSEFNRAIKADDDDGGGGGSGSDD